MAAYGHGLTRLYTYSDRIHQTITSEELRQEPKPGRDSLEDKCKRRSLMKEQARTYKVYSVESVVKSVFVFQTGSHEIHNSLKLIM